MSEAAVLYRGWIDMLNNPTIEKLMDLKLKAMAQMMREPDHTLRSYPLKSVWPLWWRKEWLAKKNARIKRLLKNASLGINACIEDIDYSPQRTIDKQVVRPFPPVIS
jgi:hypothetical protein